MANPSPNPNPNASPGLDPGLLARERATWRSNVVRRHNDRRAVLRRAIRRSSQPTWAQVSTVILGLKGLQGRVFLVGEIVHLGRASATDPIDVAVTVRADEKLIRAALPEDDLHFLLVPGVPREPSVEVTPGTLHTRSGQSEAAAADPGPPPYSLEDEDAEPQ